ncbi:hypothetical protein OS493_017367 [Desmophyllum pertusum]|uniref:Uncharacterized protein n=1 Tax=Desmophyllum pertusum TaxID=174260 RepID=A0A9X0A235_9CNID|nr:hypothetical protein OS493_017367 [Desmophyllum pertusum]
MYLVFSIAWIILELLPGTLAAEYNETAEKLHEITNPEKYHKYLRPYHNGHPVNVLVGMEVIHFVAVREMSEEFSLDLIIWQEWTDPRLSHPLNHSITLPGDAKKLIWLPDTFFVNVRSATLHDVIAENSKIVISPNGTVAYSTRITMTAGCSMNLADYPLDEQTCALQLSTYAYTKLDLDYYWYPDYNNGINVRDESMAELTLTHTETSKDVERYIDGTRAKLVARFWFKRRLGYAFLQIYIPTMMLVVLSWLSFWIPQDSIPARVALGSTTVLSIVTFTGSFRSSLPKVSYITAVDVYFIVGFAFIFAAPLEFVLVLLNSGVKRHFRSSNDDSGNKKEKEDNGVEELQEVKVEIPTKPKIGRTSSVRIAKEYMQYAFIKNEASSIDRVCRVLFPCCYAIFNLIYWTYYELATFGNHSHPEV